MLFGRPPVLTICPDVRKSIAPKSKALVVYKPGDGCRRGCKYPPCAAIAAEHPLELATRARYLAAFEAAQGPAGAFANAPPAPRRAAAEREAAAAAQAADAAGHRQEAEAADSGAAGNGGDGGELSQKVAAHA